MADTVIRTVEWTGSTVRLIDQTKLPQSLITVECRTPDEVVVAIRTLKVRGAPAIGVAAGYGVVLAGQSASAVEPRAWWNEVEAAAERLRTARPTAVNLARAVDLVLAAGRAEFDRNAARRAMLATARAIAEEDDAANRRMGALGAALLPDPARVLTHCNAGGLATTGYGTAVGVLRAAHADGKRLHVWVDETRPVLQGARLTAWEMLQVGIPHTVIPDVAAGALMQRGEVDAVIVGADRVAANGDVANKIGTYSLAVLANAHQIPFYVAAPLSTIDLSLPSGDVIPIEERAPDEVRRVGDIAIAPAASPVLNLAFDVTPHHLVSAIITEAGVVRPPYAEALRSLVGAAARLVGAR
jgi:methylthioribose-1-phosphate isomerase